MSWVKQSHSFLTSHQNLNWNTQPGEVYQNTFLLLLSIKKMKEYG